MSTTIKVTSNTKRFHLNTTAILFLIFVSLRSKLIIKVVPKKIFLTIFIVVCFLSKAQRNDSSVYALKQAELELKELQKTTFHSRIEKERIEANKKFLEVWNRIVINPKILNYPFDSLKDISVLAPHDNKFKLITWNLYKDDGTHAFFGFLIVNNSKRVKTGFLSHETVLEFEHYALLDRSITVKSPENYIGKPDKWFGMLYYSIIECDGFYILLGYDPNDNLTRRKFVDVLYFKADGTPIFGKDVFRFPRKNPKRLMFEYSSGVTMSLKYNDDKNQIVYSHLGSHLEGSALEGQYQFYGPDGQFDALVLKKGKWITIEDIDARNQKNKNDNVAKPDTKKQTPIYKPK